MQSAECQKPRKIRRTSIEDLASNVPLDDMTHDHRHHENSLFEEFHLEPFDYSDILVTTTMSMDYVAQQPQQNSHTISQEMLNTCAALDYGCLHLLDALVLQYSSLKVDHDLQSCHKMLDELISRHGKSSSSLHAEILESIKSQLHQVIVSEDTHQLIDHIVLVANDIYSIIQRANKFPCSVDKPFFTNEDTDEAMLIVRQIVDDLQTMRVKASIPADNIWNQIDSSLIVVSNRIDTILSDSQLPLYNEACRPPRTNISKDSLPPYYTTTDLEEKKQSSNPTSDLDGLISALDRITVSVPRLHDQCFELNDRHRKQMDAANMSAAMDRLARGRLDNQRANTTPSHQVKPVSNIISNSKPSATGRLEDHSLDCQQRQTSAQNCKYPEQMFISLMRRWVQSLLSYGERRRDRDRRKIKAERDRYTVELITRFERLREKTRLHNQDAVMMLCYHELDQILIHLDKTKKQFSNQRATFRPGKTPTSNT